MNINVASVKGQYDAFNLGDDRVGAPKDKIPQFVTMHLDKALLKPMEVSRRHGDVSPRARSTVFGNWSYLDHLLLPPGASDGLHRHNGVERNNVINGDGEVTVGMESSPIHKGDAVPIQLRRRARIQNTGTADLGS